MVSRYREEHARGPHPTDAIRRTLGTAGRTVFFSALTIAAAMASLLVFPLKFLYSMGAAGILVAVLASTVALLVLPAFIELSSRRVHLAGCTANPSAAWVAQQARQLAWRILDGELRPRFLLRDRDAKFTRAFDEVFRSEGVEVIRVPFRTPVVNSHADRWVGTERREVLDHVLIFGRRHLEYVLSEFVEHYQQARPHQGLGQRTPSGDILDQPVTAGRIVRGDRLGGLIHEYETYRCVTNTGFVDPTGRRLVSVVFKKSDRGRVVSMVFKLPGRPHNARRADIQG